MKPKDIFLAKMRGESAPRPGIGSATSIVTTDLMQETGISFPEAHQDPAKMAALAATGHTVLGFDNVMPLFSVWHESAALGCEVDWGNIHRMPDGRPIHSSVDEEIQIPDGFLQSPGCAVPLQALKLLREDLGNDVAIVGKVFGPWTLGYHLFGVEEFLAATLLNPDRIREIMRQLIEATVAFAQAQVDHGADAITLGDHCTRDLCSPDAYKDFLMDIHRELHERIPCPLILHICGDTSDRLGYIGQTGLECFHFDSKVPAQTAKKLSKDAFTLMGGTGNIEIVRNGTEETIAKDITGKLEIGIDVVGPECAVPLDAPYRNLKSLTESAKKLCGGAL